MSKIKKRKRTTSQIKYDDKRPALGFRIDRDLYDRSETLRKEEGLSRADIFRIGVEKLEVRQRSEKEIREKSYREGYQKAKALYAVQYECAGCGVTLVVESEADKKAAAEYFREHGRSHSECIQGKTGNKLSDMIPDLTKLLDMWKIGM